MRTVLVSAVIGMGILIVFGLIALVYGLIQKSDNPDFKFFDLATEAPGLEQAINNIEVPLVGKKKSEPAPEVSREKPSEKTTRAIGDLRLEIPKGFHVEGTDLDKNRLIVRLANELGITRLLILDINSGAKLGTISLEPAQ
jgi:hypothetical protein